MNDHTLKRTIKGVGQALAIIAFVFNLIPYGIIIGIPIYFFNLLFVAISPKKFDATDRNIVIWLPIVPIAIWLSLIMIGALS